MISVSPGLSPGNGVATFEILSVIILLSLFTQHNLIDSEVFSLKNFKDCFSSPMTQEQNKRCQAIIHIAAGSCSAFGFASAQIPGSDCDIIAPIQVTMIISPGGVFGVTIDKSWAKSLLAANIATYTGRALSQALIGWVP